MIGINRKTDYAIRCMVHLASVQYGQITTAATIALQTKAPASFVAQFLKEFSQKKLVTSFKGKSGGYILGRIPENISLLEIVEAADGPIALAVFSENDRIVTEPSHPVWAKAQVHVRELLRNISLKDLAEGTA